jgi:hypothetical protein
MLDQIVALDRISYTNLVCLSVRSHTHVAVSWNCHQLAGEANTQNLKTLEFKTPPPDGR